VRPIIVTALNLENIMTLHVQMENVWGKNCVCTKHVRTFFSFCDFFSLNNSVATVCRVFLRYYKSLRDDFKYMGGCVGYMQMLCHFI
jgi:hypothetical protein